MRNVRSEVNITLVAEELPCPKAPQQLPYRNQGRLDPAGFDPVPSNWTG